jgi:non-homologous end joining protein Ku
MPDGKVGHDTFAAIRKTIRNMDMVAIRRVVLTSREHIIGLDPLDKGLMGTLLRYPYEVRDEKEYFAVAPGTSDRASVETVADDCALAFSNPCLRLRGGSR